MADLTPDYISALLSTRWPGSSRQTHSAIREVREKFDVEVVLADDLDVY